MKGIKVIARTEAVTGLIKTAIILKYNIKENFPIVTNTYTTLEEEESILISKTIDTVYTDSLIIAKSALKSKRKVKVTVLNVINGEVLLKAFNASLKNDTVHLSTKGAILINKNVFI